MISLPPIARQRGIVPCDCVPPDPNQAPTGLPLALSFTSDASATVPAEFDIARSSGLDIYMGPDLPTLPIADGLTQPSHAHWNVSPRTLPPPERWKIEGSLYWITHALDQRLVPLPVEHLAASLLKVSYCSTMPLVSILTMQIISSDARLFLGHLCLSLLPSCDTSSSITRSATQSSVSPDGLDHGCNKR